MVHKVGVQAVIVLASLTLSCALALDQRATCAGAGPAAMACAAGPGGAALFVLLWALTLAILGTLALAVTRHAHRHRRVVRALNRIATPAVLHGHEVALVEGIAAPAVAGLLRPKIYCPADLADRLSEAELRAVLLHERSHVRSHDPARLAVLAGLTSLLPHWDPVRSVIEQQIAAVEIAADEAALRGGAERRELAAALLKLDPRTGGIFVAGFTSAAELRLRHLLGDEHSQRRWRSGPLIAVVAVGAFVACGPLSLI